MKKILYTISGLLLLTTVTGCKGLLDADNLYQKNQDTFYTTPKDIEEALNGVYSTLYLDNAITEEPMLDNLLSDIMLGGGGPDDQDVKARDAFQNATEDFMRDLWVNTYNGVNRASAVIEAVESKDFSRYFNSVAEADAFKVKSLGEAYFMRGFLMYRLARFIGGVPIIPNTAAPRDVPRSSFEETFSFIAQDLVDAIDCMDEIPAGSIPASEYGHANIWIAKGYLARIYLFYTGYMTNVAGQATSTLPLYKDGAAPVTKDQIIAHINDIINKSGFSLVPDFRNLWPYSYVNQSYKLANNGDTNVPFPYAEREGLSWVGQDGPTPSAIGTGNPEVMFALRYGAASWSIGQKYNNRLPLFIGVRDQSLVPFGQGWGMCTVHSSFVNSWVNDDLRKVASLIKLGDADYGTQDWTDNNTQTQSTGHLNMKYTTLQHAGADGIKGMFWYLYNMTGAQDMQLWNAQDTYLMRYSEILLMHSELTETADGMNQVRARAGLPAVSYSFNELKKERLYEFAFEGLRWLDLVRWGDANKASTGNTSNFYGIEIDVKTSGFPATYKVDPNTVKYLMPIPESEIRLSEGVYEQNPGW